MATASVHHERQEFVKQVAERLKSLRAQFHYIDEPDDLVFSVGEIGPAGLYDIVVRYTPAEDRIRCHPPGHFTSPQFNLYLVTDYSGRVAASLSPSGPPTLDPKETAQLIMERLADGANRKDENEPDQWDPNDG